jgi:hypothetical protein
MAIRKNLIALGMETAAILAALRPATVGGDSGADNRSKSELKNSEVSGRGVEI